MRHGEVVSSSELESSVSAESPAIEFTHALLLASDGIEDHQGVDGRQVHVGFDIGIFFSKRRFHLVVGAVEGL